MSLSEEFEKLVSIAGWKVGKIDGETSLEVGHSCIKFKVGVHVFISFDSPFNFYAEIDGRLFSTHGGTAKACSAKLDYIIRHYHADKDGKEIPEEKPKTETELDDEIPNFKPEAESAPAKKKKKG